MMRSTCLLIVAALGAVPLLATGAPADQGAWSALRAGGGVAMIRHARAPGTGDPAAFRLDDCSTQRNLDASGRREAAALGERFRAEGVEVTAVKSSRWCRALDTARLAFPEAKVEPAPALDSFFGRRANEPSQTASVRELVGSWTGPGTLVLVTHQVNVTALTGVFPREGEVVVLRPGPAGRVEVVGRVVP